MRFFEQPISPKRVKVILFFLISPSSERVAQTLGKEKPQLFYPYGCLLTNYQDPDPEFKISF